MHGNMSHHRIRRWCTVVSVWGANLRLAEDMGRYANSFMRSGKPPR